MKIASGLFAAIAGWLIAGPAILHAEAGGSAEKIPAPFALSNAAPETPPGIFEQQFRTDTGENSLTRRTEIDRSIPLKVGARERLVFKFDLASWPESLRPHARLWVAVSAPATITTEGPLHVGFSQGGVGLSAGLDYTYHRDGFILMGCDYAVRDGEVAVTIDNLNHLGDVPCGLHAIIYVPRKLEPLDPLKK